MPIGDNGVGRSDETKYKSEIVSEITRLQFRIVGHTWRNGNAKWGFPFHLFDFYCGDGVNGDGKPSSSLKLVQSLCAQAFDATATLVDKRKSNIASMRERLSEYELSKVRLYDGKALKLAPVLLGSLKNSHLGLIYIDPNGPKDMPALLSLIGQVRQTRFTDILIHIGANHIKRARACGALPGYQWYLTDMLALTGKERGFIKRSPASAQHGWIYLFLTNHRKMQEWAKAGWLDLASDAGQSALQKANLTQAELDELNQVRLFKQPDEDQNDDEPEEA